MEKKPKAHILVIEDDPELLQFLAEKLTERNYKVATAPDGPQAIEWVRRFKFDVVVSDFRMPGMDGIETLETIKSLDPRIQVIIASGHGSIETAVTAMKKGAYDFIEKPIVLNDLFTMIEKALQKSEFKVLLTLYESSKVLSSSMKLEPLLEGVMDRLQELFRADEGSFMLADADRQLYIACSRGLSEEATCVTTLKLGERVAGLAAGEGKEFLIVGGLDNYPEFQGIEKKKRILSSIVVPVFYQKKLLGVLNLNRTLYPENFTTDDLRAVSVFAAQIAQAVHTTCLYEALEDKIRELRAAYASLEKKNTTKPSKNSPRK